MATCSAPKTRSAWTVVVVKCLAAFMAWGSRLQMSVLGRRGADADSGKARQVDEVRASSGRLGRDRLGIVVELAKHGFCALVAPLSRLGAQHVDLCKKFVDRPAAALAFVEAAAAMRFPAQRLLLGKRFGEIARPVAEKQLRKAAVVEAHL